MPPSMQMFSPVMKPALSEQRYITMLAMSMGLPTRPAGCCVASGPRIYPARGDGIDPHATCKADGQRMGQSGNSALSSRVALGLRLAHAVTRGGDVHDGSPLGKIGREEFAQVERGCNADAQGILVLLVAALVDSLHQRRGIIDETVYPAIFVDDLPGKPLQYLLVGDITHEVVPLLLVNHADVCTSLLKLIGDATSYSLRPACHDDNFILEIHCITALYPLLWSIEYLKCRNKYSTNL